jgi:hypothetical protein
MQGGRNKDQQATIRLLLNRPAMTQGPYANDVHSSYRAGRKLSYWADFDLGMDRPAGIWANQAALVCVKSMTTPATFFGFRPANEVLRSGLYDDALGAVSNLFTIENTSALQKEQQKNGSSAMCREFAKAVGKLWRIMFDAYRPELHYMRGPGPKWHAKH